MPKFDLARAKAGDVVVAKVEPGRPPIKLTSFKVYDNIAKPMVSAVINDETIFWWDTEGNLINGYTKNYGEATLEMATHKITKWVLIYKTGLKFRTCEDLFETKEEAEKEAKKWPEVLGACPVEMEWV